MLKNIGSTKLVEDEQIVIKIVEGIQERKGKNIVVIDLRQLNESPCPFFVICEGDSHVHVHAVADSIGEYVFQKMALKPFAANGFANSEWIAMDYGQAIVHVFQRSTREYYNLEQLWADANVRRVENIF